MRTAKRLADALDMPLAAFFAETDELADAIQVLAKLSVEE